MNSIIKQPLAVVSDTIDTIPFDAIPFDAPSIDLPDLSDIVDTAGDVVSTIAVTGGKGVFRVVRLVRRNPRVSGTLVAMIVAAVGVTLFLKRRSTQAETETAALRVAAA